MVGSTFGWREVPYLPCPADLYELAESPDRRARRASASCPACAARIRSARPTSCAAKRRSCSARRRLDASDGHRQAAGLHARHAHQVGVAARQRRAGIPHGAHRRALRDAVRAQRAGARPGHAHRAPSARFRARARGVGADIRKCSLLHRLFQSRSLRLDKQLSAEGAASWMSGLLIGTDVSGALSLFSQHDADAPVYVIGAPKLTESYAQRARAQRTQDRSRSTAPRPRSPGLGYVYREQERQNHEPGIMSDTPSNWSPSCAGSRPRARRKSVPRWSAAVSVPSKCRSIPRSPSTPSSYWRRRMAPPA